MAKFTLIDLKYDKKALEPIISEKTIEFHYGKHHQTYVNNLNNLIEGTELQDVPLEEIIRKSEGGIFNNAAQVFNHNFYFNTFSPNPKKAPEGELLSAIEKQWVNFEKFQEEFVAACASIFGSGWGWLVKDNAGDLSIMKCSNAENPLKQGFTPLLTFDVWEHAYYLDYQNRRPDHLKELWKIVDWAVVEERY